MDLNLFESIIYGFISGIMEILPVSGQAHRNLMLQLLGQPDEQVLLRMMIRIGILAALYYGCQNHILRMVRARKLSRVPKRRRKRPLDVRSLMDASLLKTMAVPVILSLLFYGRISQLNEKRIFVSVMLFLNGVILYVPQFLPGSNRDSRTLSRVEGLWMGLGGAMSLLPGISATGAAASIGSICGVDRNYGLNMTFLMCMILTAGLMIHDVLALISLGLSGLTFMALLGYILAGAAAFGGAFLGIRLLRAICANRNFGIFAFYCWGVSLFTFILNLIA